MDNALYDLLRGTRARALALVAPIPESDQRRMHHKDLSPLLWHLGHLLYTEQQWIAERLAGSTADRKKALLFRSDGLKKTDRGLQMPELELLVREWIYWDQQCQDLLARLQRDQSDNPLMRNQFVVHFLIQHHSQHIETMRQILAARALGQDDGTFETGPPLRPRPILCSFQTFAQADTFIGRSEGPEPYDNERPRHALSLPVFAIATRPIDNAQYLAFIEEGGYANPVYWSAEGWQWRCLARAQAPWHWRQNTQGLWYGVGPDGAYALRGDVPASGINGYEASAVARYAHARLPMEAEWETAAETGRLEAVGAVWEWCANHFYPYPQFKAFPYRGYSMPWFDGSHLSLRGGSVYTEMPLRRYTFRNFYSAEKRHIFAGVRLCLYQS